ncbi:hypothetical protein B0H67DRAFT_124815 [Lasiosphaeris hirsuta]|uniref:Uncharacterized protein n=1 Tax=Lasiosphaeris hirsuta TaxID=260670 RepID=A0AA40B046_9PEZI|nr:hypothetical protein B0H67DRAFT_124815 [Lasiosphaeris hirsuta]
MRFFPMAVLAFVAVFLKANAHPIGPGVNETVVIPLPGGGNRTMTIPIPRHVISFKTYSSITCGAEAENKVKWHFLGADGIRCLDLSAMTGAHDPWHLPRAISNVSFDPDCRVQLYQDAHCRAGWTHVVTREEAEKCMVNFEGFRAIDIMCNPRHGKKLENADGLCLGTLMIKGLTVLCRDHLFGPYPTSHRLAEL